MIGAWRGGAFAFGFFLFVIGSVMWLFDCGTLRTDPWGDKTRMCNCEG